MMAEQLEHVSGDPAVADSSPASAAEAPAGERQALPDNPDERDLAKFRDVPLELGVQLDRRRISVREVLALDENSLIRLDRSTGENVDLLLNGILAGGGEIVVIDDMVGLRITDIYSDGARWEGAWRRPGR